MRIEKIRVYYIGAGMISIEPLKVLESSPRFEVLGVATQPDKLAGRKKKFIPTPLGQWADNNMISVDKPVSVNSEEFIEKLDVLKPDIIFVASFGQILKTALLDLPICGCVNLHASLLPAYRGASPIAAAIMDLRPETGVSFMKMDEGLDSGPVYCSFALGITDETAPELEMKLSLLAAEHIESVLGNIVNNSLKPKVQSELGVTYAGKIKKADGVIDWNKSAFSIVAKIRAFYPWPGAFFTLESGRKSIKITILMARVELSAGRSRPGSTIQADKNRWVIACGEYSIELLKVKPEGKNEMSGVDFVRGRPHFFV